MSCLAEQAKILCDEAEENNLDFKVKNERWERWYKCSMCEQRYYGAVACALGWACWKTYLGRPETDRIRLTAIAQLAGGLFAASLFEDALPVQEAELSLLRRLGVSQQSMLATQANLACTYRVWRSRRRF